jgi:DNA-binding NtrC family response regulator
MNLIWLKSCSVEPPEALTRRDGVIVLDTAEDPLDAISAQPHTAAVVEIGTPDDVERAIGTIDRLQEKCPVWIYQPDATIRSTVSFLKAGASHVITTPEEMEEAMTSALEKVPAGITQRTALIGVSRAMQTVSASIALVASRRCNVLIEGETGTGKEVVAREIHRSGSRARGPWVVVNCGAIPEPLLEAELFGHARGAFTGAVQSRAGKFEAANHGTIFLDEIGDMPLAIQVKLLRVLQEKEIERLGGNERIRLDVRVIAATNANLREKLRDGSFRQDLFYRLNVFQIFLPPLRERPADIPVLARHFLDRICHSENLRPKTLDASALDLLLEHTWPGNARELENAMETAIILSGTRSGIIASDIRIDAPATTAGPHARNAPREMLPSGGLDYQQALESFELSLLTQALARTRGNKTAAAELLRLKRTTLSARMRVLESRMPRLVVCQAG